MLPAFGRCILLLLVPKMVLTLCNYIYMWVASRNHTFHIFPISRKWQMKLAWPTIVFTGSPEGYQTSFWTNNFGLFIISCIATKNDEPKCPLVPILAGSLVCVSLIMMSSTELSICSSPKPMGLSGCFSTPSSNTRSSSSSSSSGVRSLRRKRCVSNYLMGTASAPFESRTLEKSFSSLASSTSTSRWVQVDFEPSDGSLFKFHLCRRHFYGIQIVILN